MSIVIASVIAAVLLIVLSKIPVALAMARQEGGYDNHYPRDQQAALSGFGRRAAAAHNNCIEAFPVFATGVLLALWAGADAMLVQNLCVVFICARVAYLICYWMDWDKARSTVWTIGLVCSIWLMALAI